MGVGLVVEKKGIFSYHPTNKVRHDRQRARKQGRREKEKNFYHRGHRGHRGNVIEDGDG